MFEESNRDIVSAVTEHDERAKTAADPERGAADADAVEAVTEDSTTSADSAALAADPAGAGAAAETGERTRQEPEVVERTLFDRRNIVGQAVQQIRMQPAQLRGLDERVTDLLSRADHLMNVVLPAALAARPPR